jgi:Flp pilus assembly protein TadB
MKSILFVLLSALALATSLTAQPPGPSPSATAPAAAAIVSPTTSPESETEQAIRKKHKKHFNLTIGDHDKTADHDKSDDSVSSKHRDWDDDIPPMIVPLVGVVFLTIFGAPVLIVAVIMYFGFSKNRMMHRTVRMMVEKGQEVPAALLAPPPPAQRQRSDMRRGVVLMMIGLGLMLFLAAVNDWEGGAWAVGIIPFLIGAGYLIVWKLEGKVPTDNPPPLP